MSPRRQAIERTWTSGVAEGEAAGVTHEDRGRMRVVPEEPDVELTIAVPVHVINDRSFATYAG